MAMFSRKKPCNVRKPPDIDKEMCHKMERKPKEYVIAYDVQGIRKLMVPDRDPIDVPGILPQSELDRLRKSSRYTGLEERIARKDEAAEKISELQKQSEARKQFFQSIQAKQRPKVGSKLSYVERTAKARNMYLRKRSFDLIIEQDNRVERANGVILATKCRAIRNAQIAEKELIAKQLQEENRRLDMMMELNRQKAIEAEEIRKQQIEKERQAYMSSLADQLRINEIHRMIKAEKKEEESRVIHQAMLAQQKREEEKLKAKNALKIKIRNEVIQATQDAERYKLVEKEEQKIADLRIQKFMEQKLEREMTREKELSLARDAKRHEIARMCHQQQEVQTTKAEEDEMYALKVQEEVERKWRENEIALTKARKEQQDLLMQAREKQIQDLRIATAIELAKEEEDLHNIAKIRRDDWEKEMAMKKKRQEQAEQHRKDLLKQINEKETERIMMQKEKFEEASLQLFQQQKKDLNVKEHLKKKIDALRNKQLPDQYIKEIEHYVCEIVNTQEVL